MVTSTASTNEKRAFTLVLGKAERQDTYVLTGASEE